MKNILLRIYNNHFGIIIFFFTFILFILICPGINFYTDNHEYFIYALDIIENGFYKAFDHRQYRIFMVFLYFLSFKLFGISEVSAVIPAAFLYSFIIFFTYKILQHNQYQYAKLHSLIFLSLPPFILFFMVDLNFTELAILFNLFAISFLLNLRSEKKIINFLIGIFIGFAYLAYSQLSLIIILLFFYFLYKKKLKLFSLVALGALSIFLLELLFLLFVYENILQRFILVVSHKEESYFRSILQELTEGERFAYGEHQMLNPRQIAYSFILLTLISDLKRFVNYIRKYFFYFALISIFTCSIIILNTMLGNIYHYWRYYTPIFVIFYFGFSFFIIDLLKGKKFITITIIYSFAISLLIYSYGEHNWYNKNLITYAVENNETVYTNLNDINLTSHGDLLYNNLTKNKMKNYIVNSEPYEQTRFALRGNSLLNLYLEKNNLTLNDVKSCKNVIIYSLKNNSNPLKNFIKRKLHLVNDEIDVENDLYIFNLSELKKCKIKADK